jgi:hypothetical protein
VTGDGGQAAYDGLVLVSSGFTKMMKEQFDEASRSRPPAVLFVPNSERQSPAASLGVPRAPTVRERSGKGRRARITTEEMKG